MGHVRIGPGRWGCLVDKGSFSQLREARETGRRNTAPRSPLPTRPLLGLLPRRSPSAQVPKSPSAQVPKSPSAQSDRSHKGSQFTTAPIYIRCAATGPYITGASQFCLYIRTYATTLWIGAIATLSLMVRGGIAPTNN